MRTREEALKYGLSFPNTYQDAPFHDENWQLVRVKGTKATGRRGPSLKKMISGLMKYWDNNKIIIHTYGKLP